MQTTISRGQGNHRIASRILFTFLALAGVMWDAVSVSHAAGTETSSGLFGSGILIEAEQFATRRPDDGTFAVVIRSPFAFGGHAVARFFLKGGHCIYTFSVRDAGTYRVWLRYASNQNQRVRFAVDGPTGLAADAADVQTVEGTGALTGQTAWNWAELTHAPLKPGPHRITLFSCPLRPDCLWISRTADPPDERVLAKWRLDHVRTHLANPIEPITPSWLDAADSYTLPMWYDSIRVCAHTRLSWSWLKKNPELFLHAGPLFASLGFQEYSRHIKSGGEPAWWPSKVGAVQPEARHQNVAQEIIDDAHKAGCRILVYHRHMEDDSLAKQHPEWCARDSRGDLIQKRGTKLCFNTPYADFIETRLVELTRLGADGFYFDEVHMPKPFCWCDNCRKEFQVETGMAYPASPDPYDPAFQKAIEFKNVTIERIFRRWREAIHGVNPEVVLLIGSNSYPQMSERHTTHRLWRIADSMKTEFSLPARASGSRVFATDKTIAPTQTDARLALGYALARDACDGRPPHVWIHGLPNARHAQFATAGVIAHGGIANLDHSENTIPDPALFTDAVALGNRMAPAFAGMRPLRWAAVHYSEYARDHYLPDESLAWKNVLYPTYGAFTALLRRHWPVGIVTDSQLEQGRLDGYRVLFLPAPQHLTDRMRAAVAEFSKKGGLVVEQQLDWRWHEPADGMAATSKLFLARLKPAVATAVVQVTGGPEKMHAIPFVSSDGHKLTVAMVNDFSWVFTGRQKTRSGEPIPGVEERVQCPSPPPCQGVVIHLADWPADIKVADVVTNQALKPTRTHDGLEIAVPSFDCASVIVVHWSSGDR